MNCTRSCMRFTVHKPDNSVGNFPCFYYGFCYFTVLDWRHIYQSCIKIRRCTTILNSTQLQAGSDTEIFSNCFASHMTCLVPLITRDIGHVFLNATQIFLCHFLLYADKYC